MTTAHRPTFFPAQGGGGKNEGDLTKLSKQYSARDMPSHTKLKYRQEPQEHEDEPRKSLRRRLEERETLQITDGRKSSSSLPSSKRSRHEEESNVDGDDPLEETNDADLDDSDDDSEDEEALMAELAAIKKERASERAEKEARETEEQERVRREDLLHANPLLQSQPSFIVKRRWDEDVVFRNTAKSVDDKKQPNFINDSIRSDFHRKFMSKYIK